ncbi:ribonuclease H-like domain-containing protein [Tanacetum coccineum]
MEALHRNNTWVLADLPVGRKAIGSKWIFKINYKASSEIHRYKARLVAQGFGQRKGIDYEETFSLVVEMVIVRCLIGIAVSKNWPLFQLDVNNAFLYGDLDEEVYMTLPPGYYDKNKTKVCKLVKSLYGPKQASRQWNVKLTSALLKNVFIQSKNDYSLYVKIKKGLFIGLLVYVDDIVITGNDLTKIENFKSFLSSKFMIKDLGKLKYFLGIEQNTVLSFDETKKDKFLPSMTEYQKLVGKHIYLFMTRPDIAYVVHCLSQHMHAPLQSHFSAGLRVLRYLKQSPGTGI